MSFGLDQVYLVLISRRILDDAWEKDGSDFCSPVLVQSPFEAVDRWC